MSSLLLRACVHSDVCINIYIDIFSFVVERFAECFCGHVDECSGYDCGIITLYYYAVLYNTFYMYFTTYLQFMVAILRLNGRGLDCGN